MACNPAAAVVELAAAAVLAAVVALVAAVALAVGHWVLLAVVVQSV